MMVADVDECDFVVYLENELKVMRVYRNRQFLEELVAKMHMMYFRFFLPNIARSKDFRMPPNYIEIDQEMYSTFFGGKYI